MATPLLNNFALQKSPENNLDWLAQSDGHEAAVAHGIPNRYITIYVVPDVH